LSKTFKLSLSATAGDAQERLKVFSPAETSGTAIVRVPEVFMAGVGGVTKRLGADTVQVCPAGTFDDEQVSVAFVPGQTSMANEICEISKKLIKVNSIFVMLINYIISNNV
jgi:secreted trypsin-like serine protease